MQATSIRLLITTYIACAFITTIQVSDGSMCKPKNLYIPWKRIRSYMNTYLKGTLPGSMEGEALKVKRCRNFLSPCRPGKENCCGVNTERLAKKSLSVVNEKQEQFELILEFVEDETCSCMGERQYERYVSSDVGAPPFIFNQTLVKMPRRKIVKPVKPRKNISRVFGGKNSVRSLDLVDYVSMEPSRKETNSPDESKCRSRPIYILWKRVRNYLNTYLKAEIPGTMEGVPLKVKSCRNFLSRCGKDAKKNCCGVRTQRKRRRKLTVVNERREEWDLFLEFVEDDTCTCMEECEYDKYVSSDAGAPPFIFKQTLVKRAKKEGNEI